MRADFVGSFLRPESVKKARILAAAGEGVQAKLRLVKEVAGEV